MFVPHVVPVYAAILAFLYIGLAALVIRARGTHRVVLGTGGAAPLERCIRVHANFAEYAPFTLLLLLMAELRGVAAVVLHVLCVCLLAGRLVHAYGVSQVRENLRFRGAGMVLTFIALGGAALAVLSA